LFSDQMVAAMLPVKDIEAAKQWYTEHLGVKPEYEDPNGVQYMTGGGTQFWIYPSQFAGTNQATAMGFLAQDLSAEMEALRSKGITFESYDIPGVKTDEHNVADFGDGDRGAWFKDPDGNIIALFESPKYAARH
jgi:catechol 2,3-dioxygenase-like lactoylglutathione lyase family enzyme